jgi:hypothetical protein
MDAMLRFVGLSREDSPQEKGIWFKFKIRASEREELTT